MTLERIHEAIGNKEKICIYGDYDCDGILATSILVEAFRQLGVEVGYHIPSRLEDGYGLNANRVEQMANKGYTLIITVDNGIKAYEAIEKLMNWEWMLLLLTTIIMMMNYQMLFLLFIQKSHPIILIKKSRVVL